MNTGQNKIELHSRNPFQPSAQEAVRWTRACKTFLTTTTLALLVACASVDSHTTQYVGAPHQPPSDPANVQILRAEPNRPNDRLGEVMVDASVDPAPPIDEVEQKLRIAAAKIGADAVVIVYDRIQPTAIFVTGGWWTHSVETITGRKLVGVAIKFKP